MKSGIRSQVIPGARMVWMVMMKLNPVRIDEKPEMKTPSPVRMTCPFDTAVL